MITESNLCLFLFLISLRVYALRTWQPETIYRLQKYFFLSHARIEPRCSYLSTCAILKGKSSYLSCRVRSIGNKSVSWIRHRDIHILTVNGYTYTSDQRFQATHHKETDDWTLQIKWAQKRDAGGECAIFHFQSNANCRTTIENFQMQSFSFTFAFELNLQFYFHLMPLSLYS